MKKTALISALTLISFLGFQMSEPVDVEEIQVINTVCDDPHVRVVCEGCDSISYSTTVEQVMPLVEDNLE